jgi:secreted protein with Ig-like and vWFA domain
MSTDPHDIRITQYVFDELNDADKIAFETEMAQDPQLRQIVEETQATVGSLQADLEAEPVVGLTKQQRQAIEAGINNPGSVTPRGEQVTAPAPAKTLAVLALAASLLLAVSVGIYRYSQPAATQVAVIDPTADSSQAITGDHSTNRSRTDQVASEPFHFRTFSEESLDESELEMDLADKEESAGLSSPDPVPTTISTQSAARRNELESAIHLPPTVHGRDLGQGPGEGGDRFDRIYENRFLSVTDKPLSTFSIDVDTASYSKVRMFLQQNRLPRPDAVRIEELVNYFNYRYEAPQDDQPFASRVEITQCPWTPDHRLARIGIKGREIEQSKRPSSNLVFLLDVSGSMDSRNKLPLLRRGMKMLVDQLGENDRVAIVVYAGAAGLVLDSTTADQKGVILGALDRLQAGGSTNGGAGIQLAYQVALDHFIKGGVNRVILCTDGDFNVGTTGTGSLVRMAEDNAKSGTFLTVLGFGMGNHNDSMMEQISNKGNGNYAFIDTENEARKVLVEQINSTLVTIAKDVKIQVEFNPKEVAAYRLIGYENRILAAEDFNDDTKDAGEIGAGHTVTALYEIIPVGVSSKALGKIDKLKYQKPTKPSSAANQGELLTVKIRYKQPDGDTSKLLEFPITDTGKRFGQADQDFRFAAAVAQFGMLLRGSEHKGDSNYAAVLEIATEAAAGDKSGYRQEFLELVKLASQLSDR